MAIYLVTFDLSQKGHTHNRDDDRDILNIILRKLGVPYQALVDNYADIIDYSKRLDGVWVAGSSWLVKSDAENSADLLTIIETDGKNYNEQEYGVIRSIIFDGDRLVIARIAEIVGIGEIGEADIAVYEYHPEEYQINSWLIRY